MNWQDVSCRRWGGYHRPSDGRPLDGKRYAYRTTYAREVGALPPGIAHHRCEHPWCIEPSHLEFITQGQHVREHGLGGDWGQADKTECPSGHGYTADNTYVYQRQDGSIERHCKQCRRQHKANYLARQKEKAS